MSACFGRRVLPQRKQPLRRHHVAVFRRRSSCCAVARFACETYSEEVGSATQLVYLEAKVAETFSLWLTLKFDRRTLASPQTPYVPTYQAALCGAHVR